MTTHPFGRDPYGNGEKSITLMGQAIAARRVDHDTRGTRAFILEDGTEVPLNDAIAAIQSGNSHGLIAQKGAFGMVVKSSPDGVDGNNLQNLPVVDED